MSATTPAPPEGSRPATVRQIFGFSRALSGSDIRVQIFDCPVPGRSGFQNFAVICLVDPADSEDGKVTEKLAKVRKFFNTFSFFFTAVEYRAEKCKVCTIVPGRSRREDAV